MSNDLFSTAGAMDAQQRAPLAERMRPRSLDEVVGQDHLLAAGGLLREMVEAGRLRSLILWGPPGSGKTTIARLLATAAGVDMLPLSAVLAGVKDIREAITTAQQLWDLRRQRCVVFVDEIHRFSKSQQDALLPHVEDGTIILIGATTENPSFEIIAPLLSRARVVTLNALRPEPLGVLLDRALADAERGLGGRQMEDAARQALLDLAGEDARRLLGTLEVAADLAAADGREIALDDVQRAGQGQWLRHDRAGEDHYNVVSALIKCLRDSDADAALYWCMRLVEAGEDPLFIVRRLVIFAAEDIGNADPQALILAQAVQQSVHFVGMPEARIPLAMACTYLASAPKSKASYRAMHAALDDVRQYGALAVPMNLRNAPTGLMRDLGYGVGYVDAHADPAAAAAQPHRPPELEGRVYYHKPTGSPRDPQ